MGEDGDYGRLLTPMETDEQLEQIAQRISGEQFFFHLQVPADS